MLKKEISPYFYTKIIVRGCQSGQMGIAKDDVALCLQGFESSLPHRLYREAI